MIPPPLSHICHNHVLDFKASSYENRKQAHLLHLSDPLVTKYGGQCSFSPPPHKFWGECLSSECFQDDGRGSLHRTKLSQRRNEHTAPPCTYFSCKFPIRIITDQRVHQQGASYICLFLPPPRFPRVSIVTSSVSVIGYLASMQFLKRCKQTSYKVRHI